MMLRSHRQEDMSVARGSGGVAAEEYEAILDSGLELGRFQEMIDGCNPGRIDGRTWFPVSTVSQTLKGARDRLMPRS
jgi:hypothetical protein